MRRPGTEIIDRVIDTPVKEKTGVSSFLSCTLTPICRLATRAEVAKI